MSDLSNKRLVVACGGTGGHLFPGIAVAEEWTKRGGEVMLFISEKQIDALATEGYDHLRFEKMESIAMPGLVSLQMPGFLLKFVKSLGQCRKLLKSFGADAVLGMGGFTSTAPLVAGRMAGLPTFIHESNSIPGRANKLNAKFSNTVLVGFGRCAKHFPGSNIEVVGTPLRPSVASKPTRMEAEKYFGLEPGKKTIMVMGGSQGARRVNELVASALPEIAGSGAQVLHISGPTDYETVKSAHDANPGAGVLRDFCSDIQFAYAAADLAICRSGASTLTELAHYGVPSILIPYPYSAEDHQIYNAEIFSVPGAAELWRQEELSEANFAERLLSLVNDTTSLGAMAEKMASLAIPDASGRVCDVVSGHVA